MAYSASLGPCPGGQLSSPYSTLGSYLSPLFSLQVPKTSPDFSRPGQSLEFEIPGPDELGNDQDEYETVCASSLLGDEGQHMPHDRFCIAQVLLQTGGRSRV